VRSLARWIGPLAVAAALLLLGGELIALHARALDLGGSTPALGEEAASYAVASRELAERGWPATLFVLPIELARHPRPPWPVATPAPGLVLADAALLRASADASARVELDPGREAERQSRLTRLEPRTRLVSVACALVLGLALAWIAAALLADAAPQTSRLLRALAAVAVGAAFLLDPEAQHLALAASSELPFTLGLVVSLACLARGAASRRPFAFGLLLGVTGSFGVGQPWLVWVLAAGAALADSSPASARRRLRTFALAFAGFALPLLPWWLYQWRALGWPTWDVVRVPLWDGIGGRSWFAMCHVADPPLLPNPARVPLLLGAKLVRNLPGLLLGLTSRLRALWMGSLVVWLVVSRVRALTVAAGAVLIAVALSLVASALGLALHRDLFAARVPLEAAGLVAAWGLAARLAPSGSPAAAVRALCVGLALLAVAWGIFDTARGNRATRSAIGEPALPSIASFEDLSLRLASTLPEGEPVMSNLGATLAWRARRPVIHLALTPADVEACRQRTPFRLLVVAFRDPGRAWPGWAEVVERPREAAAHREWGFLHSRSWETSDGFRIVWIELAPPSEQLAMGRSPRRLGHGLTAGIQSADRADPSGGP